MQDGLPDELSQLLNHAFSELRLEVRGSSKQSRWTYTAEKILYVCVCDRVAETECKFYVFLFNETIWDVLEKMKLAGVGIEKKNLEIRRTL